MARPKPYAHKGASAHRQVRQSAALSAQAEGIGDIYARMQSRLQAILDDPTSKAGDLASARVALREAQAAIAEGDAAARDWLRENLGGAFEAGIGSVAGALPDAAIKRNLSATDRKLVAAAARDTFSDLAGRTEEVESRITFAIRDAGARAIRDAVARGAHPSTTGRELLEALERRGFTPQDVFERVTRNLGSLDPADRNEALRQLVGAGKLTTFVDAGGRVWEPKSYVKMVARTKQAILYNEAAIERTLDAGVTLAWLSDVRSEDCPICTPWSGLLVALDRKTARRLDVVYIGDTVGGGPPFHPHCGDTTMPAVEELLEPSDLREAARRAEKLRPLLRITDLAKFRRKAMALGYGSP